MKGLKLPKGAQQKENAVVLCNEAMLVPVLHTLPEEVKDVNITMGFPLAQTPVYSYINALTELQTDGYRADSGRYVYEAVMAVLKHPYVRQLSAEAEKLERRLTKDNRFYPLPSELKADAFLEQVFTPQNGQKALCTWLTERIKDVSVLYRNEPEEEGKDIFGQLYRESLFKSYTLVNRLLNLLETGELEGVRTGTLKRLMNRLLTAANIPFHGEPAIGMQVMGVLETRNLDFKNLIVLSLNEGQLPKAGGESSFIPYNLRKAFGMTTIEHKNAVYAYYFYRLMQRAENVTLMYNTSTDGLNRGEMSRFMLQFLVEWPHEIRREYLEAGQSPQAERTIRVEKPKNGRTDVSTVQRGKASEGFLLALGTEYVPGLPAALLLPLCSRAETARRGNGGDRLGPVRHHLPPFGRTGVHRTDGTRKGNPQRRPGTAAEE